MRWKPLTRDAAGGSESGPAGGPARRIRGRISAAGSLTSHWPGPGRRHRVRDGLPRSRAAAGLHTESGPRSLAGPALAGPPPADSESESEAAATAGAGDTLAVTVTAAPVRVTVMARPPSARDWPAAAAARDPALRLATVTANGLSP